VTPVVDGQTRAPVDRCPGLLRPHEAEDGLVARLRLPGGQTDSSTLVELSRLAVELGEGSLQLTSRGNVQLRGLDGTRWPELIDRVAAVGLLPSITHERVRNVVASPLTGLGAAGPDLREMVVAFDAALCAAAELAELPGRFLFAFDDGRGDVTSLRFDLAYLARGVSSGVVLVGGRGLGVPTSAEAAVPLMIELARSFLSTRARLTPQPWHVAELAEPADLHAKITAAVVTRTAPPVPLGAVDGAASVGVPLSLMTPIQVAAIDRAAHGGPVVVTPWRGLVVPGAAGAVGALARAGLITDDASVWSRLTACIGAPGCAKSRISTRTVAGELAAAGHASMRGAPGQPIHVSGCERRCGAPAYAHVDLVAPTSISAALRVIGCGR